MTTTLIQMHLAGNIRFLIDRLGWSGSELARRSGVPKQFITDLLSGRSPRSLANLKKVAVALEVSGGIDELIFTDLQKKKAAKKPDSLLENLFSDDEKLFRGRFEITLKRLKE